MVGRSSELDLYGRGVECAGLTLVASYPVAFALARTPSRTVRAWLLILTLAPFFTGAIVRTYAWILVLGNAVVTWPIPMLFEFVVSLFIVNRVTEILPVALFTYVVNYTDPTIAAVSSLFIGATFAVRASVAEPSPIPLAVGQEVGVTLPPSAFIVLR